ncbi:hypothetical protein UPYG_G00246420 [Umbra pygmaea]|uniref:Ig-like domain-containing protein n=1 Tax=Umbra pygmaea TaxID=75934 RepID=A0ABD0WGB6_UMBPY
MKHQHTPKSRRLYSIQFRIHPGDGAKENQVPQGFPNIDMGPQLKVVERARTATMLCAASGNPDPEISWFKDFLRCITAAMDESNSSAQEHCRLRTAMNPTRESMSVWP